MIEEPTMPAGEAPAPTEQGLEGGRRPSACWRLSATPETSKHLADRNRAGWNVHYADVEFMREIESRLIVAEGLNVAHHMAIRRLERRVGELEIVADLAAGLDTGQDCDPAHHGLVCAAMVALNHSDNAEQSRDDGENLTP